MAVYFHPMVFRYLGYDLQKFGCLDLDAFQTFLLACLTIGFQLHFGWCSVYFFISLGFCII